MNNSDKKKKKLKYINPLDNQWKPQVWLYILLVIASIYLALVIGSIYRENDLIYDILPKLSDFLQKEPFAFDITKCFGENKKATGGSFFLFISATSFYILMDLTKNRNYMRGKEHGTSKWISPYVINRKFENKEEESANRIYSNNIRINMDGDVTRINSNVLAIGGSGVGKSLFFLTPNLYQANPDSKYPGSYIITDPKGELLARNGSYLINAGYKVRVLNLVPGKMKESDRFNPFVYIRNITDIRTLIANLFANTTPQGQSASDPFWEKAEALLIESLFVLVWMEHERYGWEMSFKTVLHLLNKANVDDKGRSDLDSDFLRLVADTSEEHPAYVAYHRAMVGAADTKRSIIISANARLNIFDDPELLRILSGDDLDLPSVGTGIVGDKTGVKTALFCIIPDSVDTYNCVAGMMYTLLFKELYYQADFIYGGKLPVPVTFWLDEFANISLPDDFKKMLTTMRSRLISCVIIIQNLAQIKSMYEKDWENIPANCDICVYLGGNEQSTFEYISKNLGKKTIWKKSRGESKGQHGSSSTNDDVMGRELLLPEEVRELDNDYCVVFVRGMKPVLDKKFDTLHSADFALSKSLGEYHHNVFREVDEINISFATVEDLEKYGGKIIDIKITDDELRNSVNEELDKLIQDSHKKGLDVLKIRNVYDISDKTVEEILLEGKINLSPEQLQEVTIGIYNGLSDEEIKSYIIFENAEDMRSRRLLLEAIKKRKGQGG